MCIQKNSSKTRGRAQNLKRKGPDQATRAKWSSHGQPHKEGRKQNGSAKFVRRYFPVGRKSTNILRRSMTMEASNQ